MSEDEARIRTSIYLEPKHQEMLDDLREKSRGSFNLSEEVRKMIEEEYGILKKENPDLFED